MTRLPPQSVGRFLHWNGCGKALANELEFVTGTVTTRLGAASGGVGGCGESKSRRDRCDRVPVTTNACFQAELAFVTGKNIFAGKGPTSSRNSQATGHDGSRAGPRAASTLRPGQPLIARRAVVHKCYPVAEQRHAQPAGARLRGWAAEPHGVTKELAMASPAKKTAVTRKRRAAAGPQVAGRPLDHRWSARFRGRPRCALRACESRRCDAPVRH